MRAAALTPPPPTHHPTVQVVRTALLDAASVASLLTTAEVRGGPVGVLCAQACTSCGVEAWWFALCIIIALCIINSRVPPPAAPSG